MSVVAAVTDGTRVWMGSDSAMTSDIVYSTGCKVFSVGSILYGVCGSNESCAAIQYAAKLPGSIINARSGGEIREGVDIIRWAYHSILPRVKEGLQKANIQEPCFNMLVGVQGRILMVDENAVSEDRRPYIAIGDGSELALGAMHTLMNRQGRRNHANIIDKAIEAACEFNPSCGLPAFVRSFV